MTQKFFIIGWIGLIIFSLICFLFDYFGRKNLKMIIWIFLFWFFGFAFRVDAKECQFQANGQTVTADVDVTEFTNEQEAAHYALIANGKVFKEQGQEVWRVFVWGGIDLPDDFSCGQIKEE